MNKHVQEPPSPERSYTGKNTGFPEPLSEDRNTTLPHPDADTSPNATIEAPDVVRTQSRRSLLSRHHSSQSQKHHLIGAHPKDLEKAGLYDNIQYADGSREEKSLKDLQDGQGSGSSKGSSEGESLDGTFEKEGGFGEEKRKKGLFKKLGIA
ncbi:hypothetical protein VTL71DRAFT_13154 [Oculimacula yallundae]|uniref:Uncharacterized protein n=1 Tax=Oculimacula yallundae TaxID=86028 RepID=A0ABR4CPR2_9HELO